ncbi:MAG TPA: hypothetical protein VN428_13280 [Bryobacteraceae bacterium]|nr:hypothetical protein [Bryobacteraceae bacterium]
MKAQPRLLLGGAGALAVIAAAVAPVMPGVWLALGSVCHQEPGMALCARCLGIYTGLVLAGVAPVWRSGFWVMAALVISASWWVLGGATGAARFGLGIALGWTAASWVITLMLCPTIVLAGRNSRPMRASATSAGSRNGTSG